MEPNKPFLPTSPSANGRPGLLPSVRNYSSGTLINSLRNRIPISSSGPSPTPVSARFHDGRRQVAAPLFSFYFPCCTGEVIFSRGASFRPSRVGCAPSPPQVRNPNNEITSGMWSSYDDLVFVICAGCPSRQASAWIRSFRCTALLPLRG